MADESKPIKPADPEKWIMDHAKAGGCKANFKIEAVTKVEPT